MLETFIKELEFEGIKFQKDAPMKLLNSFKTGGNADFLLFPETEQQLGFVLSKAKAYGVPLFILGKGSNLLVSDSGIEGAVVSLSELSDIRVSGNEIRCGAGANLSKVCLIALKNSLSGLEFAYGIPGSAGGALYMNAGAYGGEMSEVIKSARCLNADGEPVELRREEMALGYRRSAFKDNSLVITELCLELSHADEQKIKAKMDDLISRRKDKQPLEYPSAGSTFKRPEGHFAGALIEKSGLKGLAVGGACVSEKHAGFVINKENATSRDIKKLIKEIQSRVLRDSGISLETEVIFVGREEKV